MFFVIGVTQGQKEIPYSYGFYCNNCNQNTGVVIFMTYSVLSLFFIPTFKWGKRYFIKTNCCGSIYEINPEIGRMIEKGENIQITHNDVVMVQDNSGHRRKYCTNCGYPLDAEFEYCPKCGHKL